MHQRSLCLVPQEAHCTITEARLEDHIIDKNEKLTLSEKESALLGTWVDILARQTLSN